MNTVTGSSFLKIVRGVLQMRQATDIMAVNWTSVAINREFLALYVDLCLESLLNAVLALD